jgi:Tol biopolymer transport system component
VFTRVMGPFDAVNESARSAVLWKSKLDGSRLVRLSEPGIDGVFEDYGATFAPGGYIVFIRVRNADIKSAAFRMDADGSNVRRLTPWSLDADELSVSPAKSGPSEDLVVFETYGHGAPDGISQAVATVSAKSDCRHGCGRIDYLTRPRSLPVQHFNPTWSPDGEQVAYVRFSFVENDTPPVRGDIWRMRWDGADKTSVSRSPRLFDFRPAWGWRPPWR